MTLPRHLLSAADLGRDDALLVLDTAEELARLADRPIKKLPTLRGRTVVNLFFEDSTRTRTSFEVAAKRLSADVINFSARGSSVSKGESLKDTALTLEAMGADAVVVRHPASGAAGADECRLLPLRPGVQPAVRVGRRPVPNPAAAQPGDAPGSDEPWHGDRRGGRRLGPLDDRGAGGQRGERADGGAVPTARRS